MKIGSRLKRWFRQWRRKRASKNKTTPLREFVYLDDISVYSLIASRLGPIAVEFTDAEQVSLQGEIASSLSTSIGIAKGDVKSKVLSSETHNSQVLRKSIVQTTFKELYELELESLIMRPISKELKPPQINSFHNLKAVINTIEDNWIIDPDNIARGRLMELEVQLESEATFRVNTIISTLLEILQEDPMMFGLNNNNELMQMKTINRILENLLFGLIPVRGYVVDYKVVEINKKEWLVHNKLLEEIKDINFTSRPLYVVGVAEQSLFWKDIRRILFSNGRYRVMCRIAQDGIKDSWTPVKLADILDSVVPDLAKEIDNLGSVTLDAMSKASKPTLDVKQQKHFINKVLVNYSELLAEHYQFKISKEDFNEINNIANLKFNSFDTVKGRRESFNIVAKYLKDRFNFDWEPLTIAQYRAIALSDINQSDYGKFVALSTSEDSFNSKPSNERFLDAEFVAIYW